jgi:hypothetical protein
MSKGKQERLAAKVKQGSRCKLIKDDITWLLCLAWPLSFGRVEANKKAIAEGEVGGVKLYTPG